MQVENRESSKHVMQNKAGNRQYCEKLLSRAFTEQANRKKLEYT